MDNVNVEAIVGAYINLRDEINAIQTKADTAKAELESKKQRLEDELRKVLQSTGGSSISCPVGTVFVKEQTSAKVDDWQVLVEHIKTTGNFQLLNHAVNKTAVKEYLDSNECLPPGVSFNRRLDIQVRRK